MIEIDQSTNRGIFNELLIIEAINGKKVKNTNLLFQELFFSFFKDISYNDVVRAYKGMPNEKTDIVVKIKDQVMNISVKVGIKNSVHSEGIYSFIYFMKDLNFPSQIINKYLYYHYADGTMNGSGKNRISVAEYKEKHSSSIVDINKFFNNEENMEKISNRFIFKGLASENSLVDIILWGTPNDFLWVSRDETIKYLKRTVNILSTGVHFGRLSVQPANRCLNRNPKHERYRKKVEIKWYNIFDSIMMIMHERTKK